MNKRAIRGVAGVLLLILAGTVQAQAPLREAVQIGVNGLVLLQNPDGSWGDGGNPGVFPLYRDTSVVLEALRDAGRTGAPVAIGNAWLNGQAADNHDILARKILGLIGSTVDLTSFQNTLKSGGVNTTARIGGSLYSAQAWPFEPNYSPNILDTVLAYRALLLSGGQLTNNEHINIQTYIRGNQFTDGGWSFSGNTEGNEYVTAVALLAMAQAPNLNPDLFTPTLSSGRTFLVSKQNSNGSWGETPGEPGLTGLVALAIQRASTRLGDDTARTNIVNAASWLRTNQLLDGTWPRVPAVPPNYLDEGASFDTAASLRFLVSQMALSPTPTYTPEGGPTYTATPTWELPTSTNTPTVTSTGVPPTSTNTPLPATATHTPVSTNTPVTPSPTPGGANTDVDGDGTVDSLDVFLFSIGWQGTDVNLDFDQNGLVDNKDLLYLIMDFHTEGRIR